MIVTDSVDKFNEYVENKNENKNKHIFVLFYMNGCGPCEIVHPIWEKIQENKDLNNDNIIIADIEQSKAPDLLIKYSISGFPTIKYINNNNPEDYNGERKLDSFIEWIKSKIDKTEGEKNKTGGRNKRKTKGRNKRKTKGRNKRRTKGKTKRRTK
jgi:thioredoxin 1